MTTAKSVVVIGIGSPFGADTLGWQVVEQLKFQQPPLSNNIRLETCDRPGTLLLEYMKGAKAAILVDAVKGGIPGNVKLVSKKHLLQQSVLQSSHQLGVTETIALGEKLSLLPCELRLIGIEVGNTSTLYSPDHEAIKKIIWPILNEIEKITKTDCPALITTSDSE